MSGPSSSKRQLSLRVCRCIMYHTCNAELPSLLKHQIAPSFERSVMQRAIASPEVVMPYYIGGEEEKSYTKITLNS
jgi:hypothetical protein